MTERDRGAAAQQAGPTADAPAGAAAGEPGPAAVDAAATLRLIREQQERARAATEPDGRALFGAWGVAWLVGYLCLYLSAVRGGAVAPRQPETWAFAVFGSCIVAAVVFTVVHSVVRRAGTRGVSARTGAMYGWAWFLGFLTQGVVLGGLARAGAGPEVMALASNATACVVVGLLYLGSALVFGETRMYVLGVWILLAAAAATFVGLPYTYAVMAGAGGGGFLVLAVLEHVVLSRRRRAARAPAPLGAGEGRPRG